MTESTPAAHPKTELVRTKPRETSKSFARRFFRRPTAVMAAVVLFAILVACLGAAWLAPYSPIEGDLSLILIGPHAEHWLGTDALGRDVLSRLMYGGPPTLLVVLYTVAVSVLVGVAAGLAAGFWGGRTDWALSRVGEVTMALPGIVVLLAILAVFERNITIAMVALGLLLSPRIMRVVRAAVLDVRNELYVDAARVSGLGDMTILGRHIMPRVAGPVTVQAFLMAGTALISVTTLGFLGLDAQPPNPSWGSMVADAGTAFQQQPLYLLFTGGVIALTALAIGVLGDAMRDALVADRSQSRLATGRRSTRKAPASAPVPASLVEATAHVDPEALLTVEGLTLTVGENNDKILDDVGFTVRKGETVGVLGESGSGKTLTALSVLGLVPPGISLAGGRAQFGGVDLFSLSDAELIKMRGKRLSFIAQEPMSSLDPAFTVGSQLIEAIKRHHGGSRKAAKGRAVELLELVKLPTAAEMLKRFPFQLSGGQAQRVVIALALAGDPEILIADEPTTALDVTVQADILALLRSIQAEKGMSIILVTHNWGVLSDMCDRVVVMYAGQVVEQGTIYDLFDRPAHPYTQALLESSPAFAIRGEPLPTIGGMVPKPGEWPAGCHFAPRCAFAKPECRVPQVLLQIGEDRRARCIRVGEPELQTPTAAGARA